MQNKYKTTQGLREKFTTQFQSRLLQDQMASETKPEVNVIQLVCRLEIPSLLDLRRSKPSYMAMTSAAQGKRKLNWWVFDHYPLTNMAYYYYIFKKFAWFIVLKSNQMNFLS